MSDPAIRTAEPENETLPAVRRAGDLIEAAAAVSIEDLKKNLAEMKERQKLIDEVIRDEEIFVPGIHHGPPFEGSDKNTLLKPGAGLLLKWFGYIARVLTIPSETIVKLEQEVPFIHYVFDAQILDRNGRIVAHGHGSCNSLEPKYRYRLAQRKCPECEAETVLKSRDKPEWFCWKKKGGCGATFPIDSDVGRAIGQQELGKVANTDVGGLHHTIMRIAKKRALIDGALIATGTEGRFEAHEDDDDDLPSGGAGAEAQRGGSGAAGQKADADVGGAGRQRINEAAAKGGHKPEDVKRWITETYKIDTGKMGQLTAKICEEIVARVSDPKPLFAPQAADAPAGETKQTTAAETKAATAAAASTEAPKTQRGMGF